MHSWLRAVWERLPGAAAEAKRWEVSSYCQLPVEAAKWHEDEVANHILAEGSAEPQWYSVTSDSRVPLQIGPFQEVAVVGHLHPRDVVEAAQHLDCWVRLSGKELHLRVPEDQQEVWVRLTCPTSGARQLSWLGDRDCARSAAAGTRELLCGGMCLYINLDRRVDRRRLMEVVASKNKWLHTVMERLPAVDGRGLSWQQLVADRLISQVACAAAEKAEAANHATIGPSPELCSTHLTLGGCGCALSHRKAWQKLVDSQKRWALVLEDDLTSVCTNFDDELNRVLQELPDGWNICYLGFHTGRLLPAGQHFQGPLIKLEEENVWLAGLWAYLVSRPMAQTLLVRAFPMSAQVDTVVGILGAEEKGVYAVSPGQFLVFSLPTEKSKDTDVQTFPGGRSHLNHRS